MREGLPKGWTNICLKEAGKYVNGRAFKPSEWESVGLPIIRIQNLNNPDASYNYTTKDFENKFKVQNGDLLVAWSASLGVFIWNKKDAWLNQHIFRVEPNDQIIKKSFLLYALKKAIEELYKKAHGTGMVHVTKPIFEAHEILLPPLNEQKRIAAKLDHIILKIDSAKERLERIPKIIKRFRQSVLTAAVNGDRKQEHFICVSINGANEVMNVRVITIGLINRSQIHPREVFADVIEERASAVIVAHNHPVGGLIPSKEDKRVTAKIKEAGRILGINLLDHIIFNSKGYYSFVENNEL